MHKFVPFKLFERMDFKVVNNTENPRDPIFNLISLQLQYVENQHWSILQKVCIFKGGWGVLGPISTLFCPILFFFKNFVLFHPVFVGWKAIFRGKLETNFFVWEGVISLQHKASDYLHCKPIMMKILSQT